MVTSLNSFFFVINTLLMFERWHIVICCLAHCCLHAMCLVSVNERESKRDEESEWRRNLAHAKEKWGRRLPPSLWEIQYIFLNFSGSASGDPCGSMFLLSYKVNFTKI